MHNDYYKDRYNNEKEAGDHVQNPNAESHDLLLGMSIQWLLKNNK
jgi:hypothetical protein